MQKSPVQHPATKALQNLRPTMADADLAKHFNVTVSNLARNCRYYPDGPNIDHQQIYDLHQRRLPGQSGFIRQLLLEV